MEQENKLIVLKRKVCIDESECGPIPRRDKRLMAQIFAKNEARIEWDVEGTQEKKNRLKREQLNIAKGKQPPQRMDRYAAAMNLRMTSGTSSISDKRGSMAQYQKHHYKKIAFGMVETNVYTVDDKGRKVIITYGKIYLKKIGRHRGDVKVDKVMPIIKEHVQKGTKIRTDEHDAYNDVKKYYPDHKTIKHSNTTEDGKKTNKGINYVGKEGVTTNPIENVWRHVKRLEIGTHIHLSWKYFDRYLAEFMFRWNHRGLEPQEKCLILLKAVLKYTVTPKEVKDIKATYAYFPD